MHTLDFHAYAWLRKFPLFDVIITNPETKRSRTFSLILDTGATYTTLKSDFASSLGIPDFKSLTPEPVYGIGGSENGYRKEGLIVQPFGISLKNCSVVFQKFPDELEIDGMLGRETVLHSLVLGYDFPQNRLYIRMPVEGD